MTYEEAFAFFDLDALKGTGAIRNPFAGKPSPNKPDPPTEWPWPLDGVQEWFESLWNEVVAIPSDAARLVWEWLPDWISSALQFLHSSALAVGAGFYDFLTDPLGYLSQIASMAWEVMPDAFRNALSFLANLFTNLGTEITAFFSDPIGFLSGVASSVWELMPDWIKSIFRFWEQALGWAWSTLFEVIKDPWGAIAEPIISLFNWLFEAVGGTFSDIISGVKNFLESLWQGIWEWFTEISSSVKSGFLEVGTTLTQLPRDIKDLFDISVAEILAGLFEPLQATWDWLFKQFQTIALEIGGWFTGPFIEFFRDVGDWIGDQMKGIWERFIDEVLRLVTSSGTITPERGLSVATGAMGLAAIAAGGLGAMTVAGQLARFWSNLGLGPIAAMFADVANFRVITGAVLGTLASVAFATPFRHYVNTLARTEILREREFFELLARETFTRPELLRTPGLVEAVKALPGGGGEASEKQLIAYYGYPEYYLGLFRELANMRLGYFPLAGIARTGFFDREWFLESVQRTGYSYSAREALMKMYEEMVRTAKLGPNFFQLRKLYRDYFLSREELEKKMKEIEELPDLPAARLYAMDLEREHETKDLTMDIITRAYQRGIISDSEAISQLKELGIPEDIAKLQMTRERLGLMRRVRIEPPIISPVVEVVEEGEF